MYGGQLPQQFPAVPSSYGQPMQPPQHPQQGGVPPNPQQLAQQYGQFGQASQAYGGYGANLAANVQNSGGQAWQAMNFQSEDEFAGLFRKYASQRLGGIQAEELCRILNEHPRIKEYYRITWSLELCKVMVSMLDRSRDGIMQYAEFRELLQCLVYWHQVFREYDANRSGFVESHELNAIIQQRFQYHLSGEAMTTIMRRYSKAMESGQTLIAFDDFVTLSVRLRAYTEAFRARDRQQNGRETGFYQFSYDDFIQSTICL